MTHEKLAEIILIEEEIKNLKYLLRQVKAHGVKYAFSLSDHYAFNLPYDISDSVVKELERELFELEEKFANY